MVQSPWRQLDHERYLANHIPAGSMRRKSIECRLLGLWRPPDIEPTWDTVAPNLPENRGPQCQRVTLRLYLIQTLLLRIISASPPESSRHFRPASSLLLCATRCSSKRNHFGRQCNAVRSRVVCEPPGCYPCRQVSSSPRSIVSNPIFPDFLRPGRSRLLRHLPLEVRLSQLVATPLLEPWWSSEGHLLLVFLDYLRPQKVRCDRRFLTLSCSIDP